MEWQPWINGAVVLTAIGYASAAIRMRSNRRDDLKKRLAETTRSIEMLEKDVAHLSGSYTVLKEGVIKHVQEPSIHRDPERDEIRWNDLKERLAEMRVDLCHRLDRLEHHIRNGPGNE